MDNILNVLKNIIGSWQPKGQYSYNFRPSAQAAATTERSPVTQAQQLLQSQQTQQPQQSPSPTAMPQAFKFLMGQKDYSNLKPQLDAILKNTPLAPYENDFIQAGNKYGIDPRVLPTIANSESSLGRRYPNDSYNPFGYLVDTPKVGANATGAQKEQAIWQGLKNAGFTSLPMAIDRLTGRFQRQPYDGYKQFYQDPTIQNLQGAYNATPGEAANWVKNAQALLQQSK